MRKKTSFRRRSIFGRVIVIMIALAVVGVAVFKLTNKSEAAWYNSVWAYRKKLTIDHTKVPNSDQNYFVVLVNMTDSNWKYSGSGGKVGKSNGGDFVFTSSDGQTKLKHEIESYNSTTGQLIAWVQVPLVSHLNDTIIYLYYGNPNAPDQWNNTGTWDDNGSNYDKGVWHFKETSGNFADSTANGVTGTVLTGGSYTNPKYAVTGQIGNAVDISAATNETDINNGGSYWNIPGSANYTVEAWVYLDSDVANSTYRSIWGADNSPTFNIKKSSGTNYTLGYQNKVGSEFRSTTTTSLSLNTWYFLSVQKTGTSGINFYVNGSQLGTTVSNVGENGNTTSGVEIGNGTTETGPLLGRIDELKAVNTNRSADWLATEYNNQNSPSTFFKANGNQESYRVAELYYAFNEGYGTTTADSATNSYTGTLAGSTKPAWEPPSLCISGNCLLFNGTSSSVTTANTVPNVQSVGFWVKPATNTQALVDFDSGTHYISASSGTITATGFSGTVLYYINGLATTTPTLTANSWQYIEVTTTTSFNASVITIGNHSASYLNGFMDEFKLYDYVRSSPDVLADYNAGAESKGADANLSAVNPDVIGPFSSGLVGYWKMDESSTGAGAVTRADSSGLGNNLTDNSPFAASGIGEYGNSTVLVAASNKYLSIANGSQTGLGITGTMTACAWINKTSNSGLQPIISKYGSAPNDSYRLATSGTNIEFDISSNGTTVYSPYGANISTGVWYFVCGTFNGTQVRVFLNGVMQTGGNYPINYTGGIYNSTSDVLIGRDGGSNAFDGSIDEARIYNRALTATEVMQLYNFAPGPVGWWKFDEGTGTTVNDSSSNGNSGMWSGSGTSHWTQGKFGSAGNFNGSDDIVTMTQSTPYAYSTNYTVEAWIKSSTLTSLGVTDLVCRNSYFGLQTSGSSGGFRLVDTNGHYAQTTAGFSNSTWHHVVVEQPGSTVASIVIYVDGINQSTTTSGTWGPGSGSGALVINKTSNCSNNAFPGQIDDVRIYNYIRSQNQVIEDMNVSHSLSGSPVGSSLVYWKFDEGSGTTANNTGNGGSGLNGSITSGTWTNAGKFNQALTFTASTSVTTTIVDPGYNNTISLWVYPTTSIASKTLVTSSKLTTDSSGRPNYGSCVGTALSLSTWTHIVAVSNGSGSCAIYQNGLATSTGTTGVTFGTSINVGASSFTGNIDEFKFFNTSLTADQVLTIYNHNSSLSMGTVSTDSSGNAINSFQRSFCPPGNTEGNCGSGDPSPLEYWKFDENTGTTVNDSSGNGYNTTTTGSPQWTRGKFGSGLSFNTTGQYVEYDNATAFDFGTSTPFTVEAWVKLTNNSNQQGIFTTQSNVAGTVQIYTLTNNKLETYIGNQPGTTFCTLDSSNSVVDGNWHHISVVYNRNASCTTNDILIYIDGKKETTTVTSSSNNTNISIDNGGIRWSTEGGTNYNLNGTLDNAIIYSYARTQSQIAWDYNRGAPLGWYKMDECNGTTLHDVSGNGLTGSITIGGSGTYTSSGTCGSGTSTESWNAGGSGKINAALALDGNDDYAKITDTSTYAFSSGTQDFSVFAWIKRGATGVNHYVISKEDATNTGWNMQITSGDLVSCAVNSIVFTSTSTINTGWHYVGCVVSRSGNGQVYIDGHANGTAVAISSTAMSVSSTTTSVGVRNYTPAGTYFNGLIDDLRIFNYALSQQQINAIMNNGAVHFGP